MRPRFWIRSGLVLAIFAATTWVVPQLWCGREAAGWYAGDEALQAELGRGLERWVHRPLSTAAFHTSSASFDGEWLFGTYIMAALGFGQSATEHPALRTRHVALMADCIDRLLSPEVRAFDAARWGSDPIDSIDSIDSLGSDAADHVSYLGYLNLVLSLHRQLDPASRFAALNDRITRKFERRYLATPSLLLETYPHERYPVDNAAAIGSIALHGAVTHTEHAIVRRWCDLAKARYVDRATGLLMQAVHADGSPADAPRGSGTALGAYFLSFADRDLSAALHAAVASQLVGGVLGFGAVREYPATVTHGRGDVDSGPIMFGFGVSASGFSLSGARIHHDARTFRSLYATVYLFGAPYTSDGARELVTGGPIGNAILFAMLTAQPARP